MYHNCPYFHDKNLLPEELCKILEEEGLEFFYGSPFSSENHIIEDHPKNADSPILAAPKKGHIQDTSTNLRLMLKSLLALAGGVLPISRKNFALSSRIAHETVQSLGHIYADSIELQAMMSLKKLREGLRTLPCRESAHKVLSHIQPSHIHIGLAGSSVGNNEVEREHAQSENIHSYCRNLLRTLSETDNSVYQSALIGKIQSTLEEILNRYETALYKSIIRSNIPKLLEELQDNISNLQALSQKMDDFFGISSMGWDFKDSRWQNLDWKYLESASELLERDPTIRHLAEILGRGQREHSEFESKQEFETVEEYQGKVQLSGIEFGREIERMLPSEFLDLCSKETEYRLYKELLDGQLLLRQYSSSVLNQESKPVTEIRKQNQGPVVICLDTSGSMAGLPEQVAKSLCLALLQVCITEERKIHLILFSTELQEMELNNLEIVLPEFMDFFAQEFRGGTDIRPALRSSVRTIKRAEFSGADLLIISDFRVPKIMLSESDALSTIQGQFETRVHALTIGNKAIDDYFHIFDTCWHYKISPSGEGSIQGLST